MWSLKSWEKLISPEILLHVNMSLKNKNKILKFSDRKTGIVYCYQKKATKNRKRSSLGWKEMIPDGSRALEGKYVH